MCVCVCVCVCVWKMYDIKFRIILALFLYVRMYVSSLTYLEGRHGVAGHVSHI